MTTFNYINCLKPLLQALGWQGSPRRIFEAMPHNADEIDLIDLKNIFVSLGYTCYSKKNKLSKLSRSFLPTLFINESKNIFWVIYERTEKDFLYIDCQSGEKSALPVTRWLKGTRYNFIKDLIPEISTKSWSAQLFERFKRDLWLPAIMALLITVGSIIPALFAKFSYDYILPLQSPQDLLYFSGGSCLIFLSMLLFSRIKNTSFAYLSARLSILANVDLLKRLLTLAPSQAGDLSVSDQLLKLRQHDRIREFFSGSLVFNLFDIPVIILAFITLAVLGGRLVLIPCLALLLHLVLIKSFRRKLTDGTLTTNKITDSFVVQTLINLTSVKNLAAGTNWRDRYRVYSAGSTAQDQHIRHYLTRLSNQSLLILKLSAVATIFWGIQLTGQHQLTLGTLIAVTLLLWQAFPVIYAAIGTLSNLPLLQETTQHMNQFLAQSPESTPVIQSPVKPQGNLCVDNVSFRYPDQDKLALQNISMEAQAGEIVAVIGQNASGKSTFVRMLMRMHSPTSGEIRLDGANINTIDPILYRQSIGYAPSIPQFFMGTIAQNMRLVQPEVTDKEILKVFEQVGLIDELQKLPQGLYTQLTEQPQDSHSSGFLQKLNLARALIRDSNILIFDEPASNVDFKSDALFKDTIRNLKGKKTVIIVTHRPSIINLADRILVLNNGIMRLFGPRERVLNILSGNAA